MKKIGVEDVEHIAHVVAREILAFNEPIPDFATRYPHALERCIDAPFHGFGGKYLYPGLIGKAAALFYFMIKDHPFQNGNKRIAMTTLFVFLHRNKKWLRINTQELYNYTVWVASSPASAKNETVQAIRGMIRKYLIDFPDAIPPCAEKTNPPLS